MYSKLFDAVHQPELGKHTSHLLLLQVDVSKEALEEQVAEVNNRLR